MDKFLLFHNFKIYIENDGLVNNLIQNIRNVKNITLRKYDS